MLRFELQRFSNELHASAGATPLHIHRQHTEAGAGPAAVPYVLYRDGMKVFVPSNFAEAPLVFAADKLDNVYLEVRILASMGLDLLLIHHIAPNHIHGLILVWRRARPVQREGGY